MRDLLLYGLLGTIAAAAVYSLAGDALVGYRRWRALRCQLAHERERASIDAAPCPVCYDDGPGCEWCTGPYR